MTDTLWAALIAACASFILFWFQTRASRRIQRSAWQQQAELLRSELNAAHKEQTDQMRDAITFLQGQMMAKDIAMAQLAVQLRKSGTGE